MDKIDYLQTAVSQLIQKCEEKRFKRHLPYTVLKESTQGSNLRTLGIRQNDVETSIKFSLTDEELENFSSSFAERWPYPFLDLPQVTFLDLAYQIQGKDVYDFEILDNVICFRSGIDTRMMIAPRDTEILLQEAFTVQLAKAKETLAQAKLSTSTKPKEGIFLKR